jgi:CMD domain protein
MTTKLTPPQAREDRDVIEHAAGLAEGGTLQRLRRRRSSVVDHAQATLLALVDPDDPGHLSLVERAALAFRVAVVNEERELAAWYRQRLVEVGAPAELIDAVRERPLATGQTAAGAAGPPGQAAARPGGHPLFPHRLAVILDHVDRVAVEPGEVGPEHIRALEAVGLSEPEIVTVSQIAAFVSYQTRVTAGLREIAALP